MSRSFSPTSRAHLALVSTYATKTLPCIPRKSHPFISSPSLASSTPSRTSSRNPRTTTNSSRVSPTSGMIRTLSPTRSLRSSLGRLLKCHKVCLYTVSLVEETLRLKLSDFSALTHLVNFFLDENKPADVQSLSSRQSFGAKEEAQLQTLVLEGLRECCSMRCFCD